MDVKILSPNRLAPPRPVRQPVPFWTIEVVGRGGTNAEKDMGEPA